jgi:sugar lactone lactonase YvrE
VRQFHLIALLATAVAAPLSSEEGRASLVVGEGLNEPFSVDFDESGRMYIVEMGGHRVSVLDPDGTLRVLSGTGEQGLAGDGGHAAKAQFNGPHHLLVAPDGLLYVADTFNNVVRRIDLRTGTVTRVAGTGQKGFSGDGGQAVEAQFSGTFSIAFHKGALYVCDLGNRRIRRVDLQTGVVSTVAGNGEKGVPADGADAREQPLADPRAIAFDASGNLYICERAGHALRVVDPEGRIRTVAGTGEAGFSGDGGPAREAQLNGPKHISIDTDGSVLITDTENHVIRRYSPRDGSISRVAGSGVRGSKGLDGPASNVELDRPHGAVRHGGAIYISDSENHRIVMVR